MTELAGKRLTTALVALIVGLFAASAAQAQTVISGRVTSDQGVPVPGAAVAVPTFGVRTQADSAGYYRLALPVRAEGQNVTVVTRFIGFSAAQRTVAATGPQTVNFTLVADPFNLTAVVVTGVAAGTEQVKLPFTVAHVSEEQVTKVPASSPVSALEGKVAGARVSIGNGTPGAEPSIRLRGSTNLAIGGSAPLIIIDGVETRSSISDIDANDISSIEVLKGAAASSYYGSNGANGVINITTKRGRNLPEGNVQVISRNEVGESSIAHWPSINTSSQYLMNPDGSFFLNSAGTPVVGSNYFDIPYATTGPFAFRNQLKEWMQKGAYYSSNGQVGMRRGNTNFGSSFTTDHNAGVLPFRNGQYRQNARVNVDQGIGDKLDLSLSMTYANAKNDEHTSTFGGADSFFAMMQAPPNVNLATPFYEPTGRDTILYYHQLPFDPSARGNPLYTLAYEKYTLNRDRFLGSVSGRYRAFSWLNLDANYGADRLNNRENTYDPKGFLSISGQPGSGGLSRSNYVNNAWNGQLAATATGRWFDAINSTTRVATIYEQLNYSAFNATANNLKVLQVPEFDAADPASNSVGSSDQLERNVNYLGSETLDIKDRYIIDGMLRRDGSSLFGSNNRWKDFYRISGAWRVTQDFNIPGFQELKLRAGRGTAGLRPNFEDQYETYSTSGGSITKFQVGNRNLQPAIATEDEFGINATVLNRFNLELVQANRITRGAFLAVPLSVAQSGGFTQQVQNAADISARTTELSLETEVFNRPDFNYSFTLTGDHTKQIIDHLGRAPFRVPGLGQGQDMFYYKEGEPLGIMYGQQWVRSFQQLTENPKFANAVATDYSVNRLGYLVNVADPTSLIKYVDASGNDQHVIGNVNPKFNWGWANNVRFKSFSLYALVDGQHGGQIYNFTKQWMMQDWRAGDMNMAGVPDAEKVPAKVFTGSLYNGLQASDYFVESGSYVKIRELSLAYQLGNRAMQFAGINRFASGVKLALIGRNLYTWTKYSGFDPDVTAGGDFNFRVDGFRYPNFRTLTGQVELTF
jgi:TonB-linked SusC/RagA family outer membrane protein